MAMFNVQLKTQEMSRIFNRILLVLISAGLCFYVIIMSSGAADLRFPFLNIDVNIVEDLKNAMVFHPSSSSSSSSSYRHRSSSTASSSRTTELRNSETHNGYAADPDDVNHNGSSVVNEYLQASEHCMGKYFYIYELPSEFNDDLIDKCSRGTDDWVQMCGNLANNGNGPQLSSLIDADSGNGSNHGSVVILQPLNAWFNTEQFSVEVLFHNRLKSHPCRTRKPDLTDAFYIPFYAALDSAFTLFSPQLHVRDRLTHRLLGWLRGNPVWTEFGPHRGGSSHTHFMVLGRITWDFSRMEDALKGWGTALLSQPEMVNITKLLIERKPNKDEVGIPYPTSFHPSSDEEMKIWQDKVREARDKKRWLCSFIGSTRGGKWAQDLRNVLANQCEKAGIDTCKHATCSEYGPPDTTIDCTKRPDRLTTLFLESTFCLQPPGDSPTRKGLFDSLIAGCIPVFFTDHSAYLQYVWHLPQNGSLYSVFFDGNDVMNGKVEVVESLVRIASDTKHLRLMQDAIVKILPNLVYALPTKNQSHTTFHDAVDVALENILNGTRIPTHK